MNYKLKPTKSFEKDLKRLTRAEQKMVARKLKLLLENPFHRPLRTKKVRGFDGLLECSVNMDIRILWRHEGENIILILAVQ
ncbi:MAG: type II toxin-antitoxin system RelE/ParE family toxin [Limnochordia bacterium]|jgi:mRNA interferase RelE/StbE|nr:type II toxin-antitoxin system RelE/ParE family toxin [Limnochordia bacterium]MDD2630094.1 type II toxin-antitoxin system RelE/ParE family toxin [Limnochordia bacterium]MDD4517712.1 type II toxin-antitoxin system RelE/ParE family toxin [Limnochordia bacterium]